jgi:DNA-binding response OmpR family regulator
MSVAEVFSPVESRGPQSHLLPTVLVVEDDRKLRVRLTEQLMEMGVMPAIASTGFEGVRIAGAMRPELILIDGLLPEMHGLEVARFVRRLDTTYRPHIAMITAIYKNIRYHNEAKLKYGIDDYVVKPVSDAALAEVLRKAAPKGGAR